MAIRIPDRPPASLPTSQAIVAMPVSGGWGQKINQSLAFLLGKNLHPVANLQFPSDVKGTAVRQVAYTRSPGCFAIFMIAELNVLEDNTAHPATSSPQSGTISVQVAGVALTPITSTHTFDGSTVLSVPNSNAPASGWANTSAGSWYTQYTDAFDVTGLTVGTTVDLTITWTDGGGGSSLGIETLTILEVPIADTDPVDRPTTEIGIDSSWPIQRNNIYDGASSSASGTERWLGQYEEARYQNPRQCFQIVGIESTSWAFQSTTTAIDTVINFTTGNWNPGGPQSTYQWQWPADAIFAMRPRKLWGASTASRYLLRVRYQTSTTQKIVVRVSVRPGTGGAFVNYDFTLAAQPGSFAATTVDSVSNPMHVSIPCSDTLGSDGSGLGAPLAFVRFRAWNAAPGTYYISQLALIEQET